MSKGYSNRKKWNTGDVNVYVQSEEARRQQINEKHEEYLLLLQHKNRCAKKLKNKLKDPKQVELEKKEKGFSLYLNGANEDFVKGKNREQHHHLTSQKSARKAKRKPKTARETRDNTELIYVVGGPTWNNTSQENVKYRSKTAPAKSHRKNWVAGSLDIKTSRGEKVNVKAPEILTGKYEDDFETYISENFDGQGTSESESEYTDSESYSSSDEELQMEKGSKRLVRVRGDGSGDVSAEASRYGKSKDRRMQGIEGRGGEQLTLTVQDVKKLRKSLEMNSSIRESLAKQAADADSSDEQLSSTLSAGDSFSIEIHTDISNNSSFSSLTSIETSLDIDSSVYYPESDSDRESPIDEADEDDLSDSDSEIEEALGVQDKLEAPKAANHNRKVVFKPSDMVVLDFGAAKKETKERPLSAARKSNPDSYGELKSSNRPTGSNTAQRSTTSGRNPTPYRESPRAGGGSSSSGGTRGNSGILKNKTPTPVRGQKKEDVILNSASVQGKKPRPLSANRKSTNTKALDSTQETKAVIEAMRLENERMDREKARAKVTSAPEKSQNAESNSSDYRPPSSEALSWKDRLKENTSAEIAQERKENMRKIGTQLASLELGDGDLDEIVTKVLQLDSKGQRKLLMALQKIEDGTKESKNFDSAAQEPKSKRSPPKLKKPEKSAAKIHILIEILSNWGHSSRVGLTEIQIFDLNKKRIEIEQDDILAEGIEDASGDVMNIFNGKCKTVKERNMLNWDITHGEPIEFTLMIPNRDSQPNFGISKIKIWNYNRSLNDLGMGVKATKVSVDGTVIWQGNMDKGCGNQVFDYGKNIAVTETDSGTNSGDSPRNLPSSSNDINKKTVISPQKKHKDISQLQNGNTRTGSGGGSNTNHRGDTPAMDNVSLFQSVDTTSASNNRDSNPLERRSATRNMDRSRDGVLDLPVIDDNDDEDDEDDEDDDDIVINGKAAEKRLGVPTVIEKGGLSPRSSKSKADRIKSGMRNEAATSLKTDKMKGMSVVIPESVSEPRQRHRKKKERKSKMAARLSDGASIDSSTSISMTRSADPYYQDGSQSDRPSASHNSALSSNNRNKISKSHSEETNLSSPSPHIEKLKPISKTSTSNNFNDNKINNNGNSRDLPKLEQKQISNLKKLEVPDVPARPGSGLGMSDDECMLQQIRNLNVKEKDSVQKSKGVPLWLKKDEFEDSVDQPVDSNRGKKSEADSDLLENWPQAGVSHLKTVLDSELQPPSSSPRSNNKHNSDSSNTKSDNKQEPHKTSSSYSDPQKPPTSARRSNSGNKSSSGKSVSEATKDTVKGAATVAAAAAVVASPRSNVSTKLELPEGENSDEDFDIEKEVEAEMSRMQQIESSRKQWRQKEEKKLEESWSSLNIFNKLHKGRISLDVEDDILDEYLNSERNKPKAPKEPTIAEEPEMSDAPDYGAQTMELVEQELMEQEALVAGEFEIPELPQGRELVLDIKSTWGDRHYVGLNGVEFFTSTGELAAVAKVWAEPLDINVLPEYNKDPRVVTNLVDGVNRTRDDIHMWLAPYTKGGKHQVFFILENPVKIAMMRIWNYNKSRIHSYRGAKDIEINLDGKCIFKGEIARACGGIVGSTDAFGDTILFTMDEDILEKVSQNDQAFEADLLMDDEGYEEELNEERPSTPNKGVVSERPFTAATNRVMPQQVPVMSINTASDGDVLVLRGQCLKMNFIDTWGDPYYLGLTGLEVVDKDGEAIPLNMGMLEADPRDLHVLPGYERDDRTLDKLIDGSNITMSDEHMWLVPYTEGEDHSLQVNFNKQIEMTGLRIWNYNKSSECTYRGAKTVHVYLDGRQVSPPDGFLIRKGPGNCYFDFAQEISFTEPCTPRSNPLPKETKTSQSVTEDASQEYCVVQKPCGFIYQFQLLNTWGDQYYLGLNGLEFYDSAGCLIQLTDNNISAHPESVNVLPSVQNDVRTPDRLIDGMYDTMDGSRMWLAPILPGILNRVYVIFDQPMEISMIKLWNYSKTANRGVKDFALLVDDLLVYNGTLEMVQNRAILPTLDAPQSHYTILFTDDKDIRRKEKHSVIRNHRGEQDVQLMNDCKVMTQKKAQQPKPVDQALRPKTSVTRMKKR